MTSTAPSVRDVRVVLFSGGRGSGALAEMLGADDRISLTVAINGYDDGASTGEIRRFLGDSLGPSDFRKNASRFARLRKTCAPELIDLLDRRLPDSASIATLEQLIDQPGIKPAVANRLRTFVEEYRRTGRPFDFRDASVGNFVFAGGFLTHGRVFNAAVDDYCALVGLPPGLIENVTDGTNAFLVAQDDADRLVASEEELVDARRHARVREIFLIDRPVSSADRTELESRPGELGRFLDARLVRPALNPRLIPKIAAAQLIIYAPGTQHSSLFPSYLTPGLGDLIASNLEAIKLLVTNIQEDAEITGRTAVDLIDRAVFYLRDKGRQTTPAPCVITHYLVNDPGRTEAGLPYVPLGRLESLEDPRLVRVGNYEAGETGRHDAAKVLAPYIRGVIARDSAVQKVAVLLSETRSVTKLTQTLLEMVRGGLPQASVDVTVFHAGETDLDPPLVQRLPFAVRRLIGASEEARDQELRAAVRDGGFDYVVLFDSAGMYNGEDIAGLTSYLTLGRLDAVWGSRRLSVRDIEESYRLRYRGKALLGRVSAWGSHLLSLQFLFLFGRYVADTLSGARVVRASDALEARCLLTHRLVNQYLLSSLLKRRAEMLEVPVQFFAIAPDQVRRTTVKDGLQSIGVAVRERFRTRQRPS